MEHRVHGSEETMRRRLGWWLVIAMLAGGCSTSTANEGAPSDQTDVGCEPEQHDQDAWLYSFMHTDPYWHLHEGRLILESGSARIELEDHASASSGASPREFPPRPSLSTRA
jgi:hypothetical protein